MKDQRMKSAKRSVLRVLSVFLLMLALTVFGLAVSVSADETAMGVVTVKESNLVFEGLENQNGVYTKVYNGSTKATVSVKDGIALEGVQNGEDVKLVVKSAEFNSADVATASELVIKFELQGNDAYKYAVPKDLVLSARITPVELKWNGSVAVTKTYDPKATSYTIDKADVQAKLPALQAVEGLDLSGLTLTVTGVDVLPAVNASENAYETKAAVSTGNANYTVESLKVAVTVNPIVIDNVTWTGNTTWTYGDAMPIGAMAYSGNVGYDILKIICNDTKFASGTAGSYTLLAELTDTSGNYVFGNNAVISKDVTILKKKYQISMADLAVIGDEKTIFRISVSGNLPQDVLNQIIYTVNGSAFNGSSSYGSYAIKATLPVENYTFDTDAQTDVTELNAVLTIKRQQKLFPVLNEKGEVVGNVILSNPNGFSENVNAVVTALEGYPKIVKNNRYNQVFRITVTGAEEGETFSLFIPIFDEIKSARCDELTVNTLSVYESASGKLIAAVDAGKGYTVLLGEGYYQVDGFTGAGETTFVISPDYDTPFFTTAGGITILVLLALLILLCPIIVGLRLRRTLDNKQNPVIVIDTDGVLPAYTPVSPVEIPDREPVDPDAVIDEKLNEIADNMDVAAEEEETEADADALRQAVEDALSENSYNDSADIEEAVELTEETEEEPVEEEPVEEEPVEEDLDAIDETYTEELADSIAEELAETVEAEEVEADQAAVEEAVSEAMEEVVAEEEVVEESAEEAVEETVAEDPDVLVVVADEGSDEDEESDDEADEEDDEAIEAGIMDDTFGFANVADPSTFIDVKENPEAYQEMLERERRGEIRIVSRYKKSFQAKLAQSFGNVQDYYSELKNALLSFKGVKNRQSWNYEAFNKGRVHVAKMDAKTRSLYLYLAINPEDLAETKYNFTDVSSKKKYATTPVLMKIKGERKFKHAIELITMLCGDQMQLPQMENEHTDYRVPRMTIDEMVEAGIMKHQAGYIVLTPVEEEAVAVSADVTEDAVSLDETAETPVEETVDSTDEVVTDEVVTDEVVTDEVVTDEAVAEESVTEEVAQEAEAIEETPIEEETPVEESPVEETAADESENKNNE